MTSHLHTFDLDPSIEAAYTGPHLSCGPLPTLFYFSLSAKDSLCLDPFNQPVAYLSSLPMRIFSITLPGHENGLPPSEALNLWSQAIMRGENPIAEFIDKVNHVVAALQAQGALIDGRLAIAGLSRGAFLATHCAASNRKFRWILGFAPLTQPAFAKEFQEINQHPLVESLSLEYLTERLVDREVRFYIGNLDMRVSTRLCFDFIEKLAQSSKARSPNVELIIGPSIGRDGHGTAKQVFHEGAQWIAEQLKVIDVV